jgi:hypothetical protein
LLISKRSSLACGGDRTETPDTTVNPSRRTRSGQGELAKRRQVQETAQCPRDGSEKQARGVERQVQEYKTGYVQSGLSGRVLAYNPGWNFVVLNIGDRQGSRPTPDDRCAEWAADCPCSVTSVEPTQAIADVLPNSLARGATVQPATPSCTRGIRR